MADSNRPPIVETIVAAVLLLVATGLNWHFSTVRQGTAGAFVGTLVVPLLLGGGGWVLLRRVAPDLAVTRGGRKATGWGAGVLLGTLVLALGAMVSNIPFEVPEFSWRLLQHLAVLLVVPVAEEVYFRGLLFRLATGVFGKVGGAIGVSLLFGFLHPWLPFGWVMIVLSLLLCAAVSVTGTLWWAVVLHLLWNGWAEAWHAPDSVHRFVIVAVGVMAALLMTWRGLVTREVS